MGSKGGLREKPLEYRSSLTGVVFGGWENRAKSEHYLLSGGALLRGYEESWVGPKTHVNR